MGNSDLGSSVERSGWLTEHPGYGAKVAFTKLSEKLGAEPIPVRVPGKIVLVLDISGSMSGEPMANLRSAAEDFIMQLHDEKEHGYGDSLGIVTFDGSGHYYWGAGNKVQLLKTYVDMDNAESAIESLKSSGGSTNIGSGLALAQQMLDGTDGNRAIVLISDGVNDSNAAPTPSSVVDSLKSNNIPVYTVSIGDGADKALLKTIAVEDERFHPADDANAVVLIFNDILYEANITKMLYNEQHQVAHGQPDKSNLITVPGGASRLTASVAWADPSLHWKYEPTPQGESELAIDITDENGDILPQELFKIKTGADNCVVFDFKLDEYRPSKVQVHASTQPISGNSATIPITISIATDVSAHNLIVTQSSALVPTGVPIYYGVAVRDEESGGPVKIDSVEAHLIAQRTVPHDEYQAQLNAVQGAGQTLSQNSARMAAFSRWAAAHGEGTHDTTPLNVTSHDEHAYGIVVTQATAGIYRLQVTAHLTDGDGESHTLTRIATAYVYDPSS